MDVTQNIKDTLGKALLELGVQKSELALEFPTDISHGDFATNVALVYGKELGKAPRELAEEIVSKLGTIANVSKIEIAGPGFINFHLSSEYFAKTINSIAENSTKWGANDTQKGKQIMVEYTDPNPFKAFHIGHLMSNTIGESIARLIENSGAKVVRANYQGDVGVHVACAIWGMRKLGLDPKSTDDFGRAYAEGASAYEDGSSAKEEIDIINTKLYDHSDSEIDTIYGIGRKASLEAFEHIYGVLGTKFNEYFFESKTGPIGKEIVEAHPEVFPESDGARVFRGEEYGLHTRVFINSKGLPTYEAKELGLVKMKMEKYPNSALLYVVTANEVVEYFKVVQKAMEQVFPDIADKLRHVAHGVMRLESGKMSSRTGNVLTGESLINDLVEVAHVRAIESRAEDHDLLAKQIAVAAIKFQILKGGSTKDIVFDKERALSLEGDSGPYLQYTYARTSAIIAKANEQGITAKYDVTKDTIDIARVLYRFPMIAMRAQNELEPHYVANYLITVASLFNTWYAQEQILDGTSDASHKVAIVSAVATTLGNGLNLLGIDTPEKM